MIASVLVEIKAKCLDKTFEYLIPSKMISSLQVGMRVLVPFGYQKLEGYVLTITNKTTSDYELKEIIEQIDEQPVLNSELLEIGKQMKELTLSSLSSAYSTMLPRALKARRKTSISKKFEIQLICNIKIDRALKLCKNDAQKKIISLFEEDGPILKKVANQISSSAVKTLIKQEILKEEKIEVYRYHIGLQEQEQKKELNEEQKIAFEKITTAFHQSKTFLLHGVTGSGKTEIYLQVIDQVIKENQQALVLVPEISLTPQFVQNFAKRFPDEIAVLHSGLSNGEKYDEWRKIMRGETKIVIGARSAIFAPLERLGIIIIDECHSDSYKQENNPKYHVLDMALFRSKFHQCPVVLGSATPNLEIMARAQKGVFELIELKERVNKKKLPSCILVDMKEEIKHHHPVISRILEEKIQDRLQKKEQIMILLNRRGHSTFIQCSACGFTYKCPYCDISLTYHQTTGKLHCHYCGYTTYKRENCPKCQEQALNYYGLGTEKLEQLFQEKFPTARIVRMDTDTTQNKGDLDKIITGFLQQEYDILIGTQMISKGLDFPKVTLVGIVHADLSLNIPDFRSGEKTFALLCQASGRAGRKDLPGEVIIETFNPDNKILAYAVEQNYEKFYRYEMAIRKQLKYPPYYFLAKLKVKGKNYEEVKKEAAKIAQYLKKKLDSTSIILGPTPASLYRINNVFYFEIMIKYRFDTHLKNTIKELDQIFLVNKNVDLDIDFNH